MRVSVSIIVIQRSIVRLIDDMSDNDILHNFTRFVKRRRLGARILICGFEFADIISRAMTDTPAVQRLGLAPDHYRGKTVVVTGAGRGIGRAAADAFAWLGANVVIAEISDEGLEVEDSLRRLDVPALFVRTDVASEESVKALVEQVRAAYGHADILVNNAIIIPLVSVVDMDVAQWDKVMVVNLRGTFLTCRGFLPSMLERRSGVIINMVSLEGMPGLSAYIASKQGVCGFSQSLAAEVGEQGVRVIPFAPGMIDTPGLRSVATGLSARLGLSQEQFLGLSLHPAYDGFMPLDHAGAATAYLAAVLADEYQGEVVTGYTVLERAGLIRVASLEPVPDSPTKDTAAAPAAASPPESGALPLLRQLLENLGETEIQFGKLPLFARPLARNGFKSKSGRTLAEWKNTVQNMIASIEAVGDIHAAHATSQLNKEQLSGSLLKLRRYYAEEPAEVARFTKDQGVLEEARSLSARRTALIDRLIAALDLAA
jgi:NAD(P)-dependent dehydrogenase (short-subunit alcohol dehydrogenase family)